MLDRSSPASLSLRIQEQVLEFPSPLQFEFALSGRTSLPAEKLAALVVAEDEVLLKEAEAIRRIEQRFEGVLSGVLEDTTSVGGFMQSMDLAVVSNDHDWRSIISALKSKGAGCEEYKKCALVKYMQYLNSRQETIRSIYGLRQRLGAKRTEKAAARHENHLRETVIFEAISFTRPADNELTRMPKGESVDIELEPDRPIAIQLAKHAFTLVAFADGIRLSGKGAETGVLRPGRNVIGRDAASDVVVDSELRDISRRHLIVETDGRTQVRLTDISSHGTSIPPTYLDRTGV